MDYSKCTRDPDFFVCRWAGAVAPVWSAGRPTSTAGRRGAAGAGRERRVPAAAGRPPWAGGRAPAPRPGSPQPAPGLRAVGPAGVSTGPPPDVGLHGPRVSQGVGAGRLAYGTWNRYNIVWTVASPRPHSRSYGASVDRTAAARPPGAHGRSTTPRWTEHRRGKYPECARVYSWNRREKKKNTRDYTLHKHETSASTTDRHLFPNREWTPAATVPPSVSLSLSPGLPAGEESTPRNARQTEKSVFVGGGEKKMRHTDARGWFEIFKSRRKWYVIIHGKYFFSLSLSLFLSAFTNHFFKWNKCHILKCVFFSSFWS